MPRKMYMSELPTWLLMFLQYEYPALQRQSWPSAQSLASVSLTPAVLYGAGNVKAPRAPYGGRKALMSLAVRRARSAGDPDFSSTPSPDAEGGGSVAASTADTIVAPADRSDVSSSNGYTGAVALSRISVPFLKDCTGRPVTPTLNTSPTA